MDEYAELLMKSRGPTYRSIDPGDLSEQREIRQKLKCKPFKWYMEEIAFDVLEKFPLLEPPDYGSGKVGTGKNLILMFLNDRDFLNYIFHQIMPVVDDHLCLKAARDHQRVQLTRCFSASNYYDFEQVTCKSTCIA
jgi:hypothetical protein